MKLPQVKSVVFWVVTLTLPLVASGLSFGEDMTVVSPNGLENAEGNTKFDVPTSGFRVQWLYPAEDFGSMPDGGAFIIGWAIRADGEELAASTTTFADSTYILSTTSLNSLGPNFADNHGGDATVVFDGSTSLSFPVSGPPGGPHPFGDRLDYQTPFFYDPSLGNLLVEQVSFSGADLAGAFKDWEFTGSTTEVFAPDPQAATATIFNHAIIVTQFTMVPEPNSLVLLIMAFLSLLSCERMRRHRLG